MKAGNKACIKAVAGSDGADYLNGRYIKMLLLLLYKQVNAGNITCQDKIPATVACHKTTGILRGAGACYQVKILVRTPDHISASQVFINVGKRLQKAGQVRLSEIGIVIDPGISRSGCGGEAFDIAAVSRVD